MTKNDYEAKIVALLERIAVALEKERPVAVTTSSPTAKPREYYPSKTTESVVNT